MGARGAVGNHVVLRYVADKPGLWTLHCHHANHFLQGFSFRIVQSMDQLSEPPADMGLCGPLASRSMSNVALFPSLTEFATYATCPDEGGDLEVNLALGFSAGLVLGLLLGGVTAYCCAGKLIEMIVRHKQIASAMTKTTGGPEIQLSQPNANSNRVVSDL